jgi:hypothetical protein
MNYEDQLQKITEELNDVFMGSEPLYFKQNSISIGLSIRPSKFISFNEGINHISEAGKSLVDSYLKDKYGVTPTWHHHNSLGFYDKDGEHLVFLK